MKHICYIYIFEYKCLKNIEFVLDSHYSYRFGPDNKTLTITKNKSFPTNFWGNNIYSVTALVGNNGSGKSTTMSFLLDFLVEGSASQSVNGIIVYENNGKLFYYGNVSTFFEDKPLESINTSLGLKDSLWKIPCFYYSGHFSPNINDDPRNSHLMGSYFASDNMCLVEDLQNDTNDDSLHMQQPLINYLNSYVAQNNYRICTMLANSRLSSVIKEFTWPRYVVIGINKSGITSIRNSIKKEELIREKQKQTYYSDAKSLKNYADVYRSEGEYEKALEYYKKAMEIRRSELGKVHSLTATNYNDIAETYEKMGNYDKALENYKKAMELSYDEDPSFMDKDSKENSVSISIPPFKSDFDPSSEDYFFSELIYNNLLNIINDKWNWKNGFGIINDWQGQLNSTTPVLKQLFVFIKRIDDEEKKETLKFLYEMLIEIQNLTTYKNDGFGKGFLFIDCMKNKDNLINLGEKVLKNNKFYLTSRFFDFFYAQTLDTTTMLSSGEQKLLDLFSRLYDAIVLRPDKFSNLQSPSLLMLDEAEIGFHPDWQRRYLKLVIDFIDTLNMIYPKLSDYQIVISTHSPILLSDIPKCCTNYLKRKNGQTVKANSDEISETFAENVFQLYRRSFFMEDGLVGEFARGKINRLEKRINKGRTKDVLNEIRMIGDDRIREFLMDKYLKKHLEDELLKEEIIKYYEEKVSQLRELKSQKK